ERRSIRNFLQPSGTLLQPHFSTHSLSRSELQPLRSTHFRTHKFSQRTVTRPPCRAVRSLALRLHSQTACGPSRKRAQNKAPHAGAPAPILALRRHFFS